MTTYSDGEHAKQVLQEIRRLRPALYNRIKICKGTRAGFTKQQRVLQVTLTDGQYYQVCFARKGTHFGQVVGELVDYLMKWKVRDDHGHPVCPDEAGVLVCDVADLSHKQ